MFKKHFFLFIYVLEITFSETDSLRRSNSLNAVWKDLVVQYIDNKAQTDQTCPSCSQISSYIDKKNIIDINITNIRIEIAKKEILRKLGMTTPPIIKYNASSLPVPIVQDKLIKSKGEKHEKRLNSEKIFLVATEYNCSIDHNSVLVKMKIDIPEYIQDTKIFNSKLWLYLDDKIQVVKDVTKCTFISKPCSILHTENKENVLMIDSHNSKDGWIESDITWWLQDIANCYELELSCSLDTQPSLTCFDVQEIQKKPFVVINFKPTNIMDVNREKRNINCIEGATECCREHLYISFPDIGWGDWIIQPKGYEAYYCKGTCASVASISLSGTSYHSVLKKFFLTHSNEVRFAPCCAPTRLLPIQLIYVNENGTIFEKIIPDLTVDSCGCM